MEQYVQALLARQQAVDHLETIREQINCNQLEMNRLLTGRCTAGQAEQVSLYQRSLEKQQDDRVAALALAERRVNLTFQAMLAARQQCKIVETYRHKQQSRHQREELRQEQKLLDDLASRRARSIFSLNPISTLP